MTGPSAPYRIADHGPQVTLAGVDEPPAAQCSRCGAVGTHYLTCPSLRLPAGYRLSDALDRGAGSARLRATAGSARGPLNR